MYAEDFNYQQLIVDSTSTNADMMRFCLSDKVSMGLECILHTDTSPIKYAKHLLNHDYKKLRESFYYYDVVKGKTPRSLIEACLFDDIMSASVTRRVIALGLPSLIEVKHLVNIAEMTYMIINNTGGHGVPFSGFAYYSQTLKMGITHSLKKLTAREQDVINKLCQIVSSIDSLNWILYDKKWFKLLSNSPKKLLALSHFLQMVMFSFTINEEIIEQTFGISYPIMFAFVDELWFLRTDPKATMEDINHFFSDLMFCLDEPFICHAAILMFGNNFAAFKSFYDENFRETPKPAPVRSLSVNNTRVTFSPPMVKKD